MSASLGCARRMTSTTTRPSWTSGGLASTSASSRPNGWRQRSRGATLPTPTCARSAAKPCKTMAMRRPATLLFSVARPRHPLAPHQARRRRPRRPPRRCPLWPPLATDPPPAHGRPLRPGRRRCHLARPPRRYLRMVAAVRRARRARRGWRRHRRRLRVSLRPRASVWPRWLDHLACGRPSRPWPRPARLACCTPAGRRVRTWRRPPAALRARPPS